MRFFINMRNFINLLIVRIIYFRMCSINRVRNGKLSGKYRKIRMVSEHGLSGIKVKSLMLYLKCQVLVMILSRDLEIRKTTRKEKPIELLIGNCNKKEK